MLKQRLYSVLALALAVIAVGISPALAQQTTYTDPAGRFTAQIPAGWQDESTADYGLFTSDNGISVYLIAVQANDVQAGIDTAIKSIDSTFSAKPVASSQIPLPSGTWTQAVYAFPDGSLQVGIAQVKDGVAYVLYIKLPDQAALQAKQDDLNTFLLSFTIGKPVDLSGKQPAVLTDATLVQLTSYIKDAMARYNTVGAAVAVVQGGKVVYSQGFGTLEQSGSTPVNSQTLFMIGSTTKSMTTMMAATLVDDGVLNWDTPATDILPDFALSDRAATEKIRVRDLFNMSSGVPRYDIPLALKTFTPQAVQEQIALIPLDSQPGDKYHYSNFMVTLGGYAAAVAAGADLGSADDKYAALMQQRVFQPIGMSATTLDFDGALANANHAVSYSYDSISGQFLPMPMNFARAVTATAPAGGVWSNADDMAKYMMTELSRGIAPDGKRVVSEQNLLETWKPEIDMGGSSQYGMGWMIGSYHGQRLINHGGNIAGFTSDFGFLPDAGLGALVLSNRSIDNNFGASIREYVFESAFGLDHSADAYYSSSETSFKTLFDQLIKESGAKDQPVDPRTVANYVGDYQDGVKIGFPSAGQFAVTTAYGDIPLLPTNSSDHFVSGGALMGNDVVFSEDGKGQVTMTISSLLGVITGETQPYTLKKTG